jgi:hypothetical protein
MPERRVEFLVVLTAAAIVLVSAAPHAGSPNDGSRLATVESLVDYHTLAVEESIFVKAPPRSAPPPQLPYPLHFPYLPDHGTVDKIFVNGHFYSDKPPVQAVLLAGLYQVLQWPTGLRARDRADLFCYAMTLGSSGVAYVLAVWSVYRLGRTLGLSLAVCVLLAASLGLSTLALPYARHVNNNIVLLGLAMAVFAVLASPPTAWKTVVLGALTGLGYAIEQPTGGLLLAGALVVHWLHRPRFGTLPLYALGALPWIGLHHGLSYSIAQTWRPLGALPEHFDYPGSEVNAANMTGVWNHAGPAAFLSYAAQMLIGEHGFLECSFPLWLAVPASILVFVRAKAQRWIVLLAVSWSVGVWLIYAALSNNFAGVCLSIRWFVPLLAAGYCVLALGLREEPSFRGDLAVLSFWGALLGATLSLPGPWDPTLPYLRPLQIGALVSWLAYRLWYWLSVSAKSATGLANTP